MLDIVEICHAIAMVDIVDIVDIDDIVGIIDIVDTVEAIWNNARLCNNQSKNVNQLMS